MCWKKTVTVAGRNINVQAICERITHGNMEKKSSWARENYTCVFYIYWVECSVRWRCTLYTYINVIRVASSSYFKCTLFFQKYDKKYFLIILHWNNYKVSPLCKSDIEDFVGQKVDDSHI